MKRLALLAMLLGFGVTPAFAQNPNTITPSPQTAGAASSGACTRNTDCATWDITNVRSVTLQVSGTFSGTLTFEGTTDGTNWVPISLVTLSTGLTTTTTTAVGQFSIVNSGLIGIRARMTTYASGTASVWAQLGQGGSIPLTVSGSVLPSSGCVSWNGDTWLQRTAAGKLGISAASCGGANNGTLSANILAPDGTAAAPSLAFASDTNTGLYLYTADTLGFAAGGVVQARLGTNAAFELLSNTAALYLGLSSDVILTRDAANTLALRNGTANQEFRVYQNVTGSKYISTSGTGGIQFVGIDNTVDIGASGATRPRTAYVGTSVNVGTNPSTSGALNLANAAWIYARNAANTGDVYFARIGADNLLELGVATVHNGSMKPYLGGGNTLDIGTATLTFRTGYFGTSVESPVFKTTTALVALGGGAAPTLGTIGGSGPASAAQNSWVLMKDSTGASFWVPVWK